MKNKHEKLDTLLTKYPEVFVDKNDKYGHNFEGFRCNEGWFAIVEAFCKNLKSHNEGREAKASSEWYRNMNKMIEGGDDTVICNGEVLTMENAHKYFPIPVTTNIKISCVKEKFGSLSIYCDGGAISPDDCTWGMITLASTMSHYFCEDCGTTHEVGKTHGDNAVGCVRNICKPCYEKWKSEGYHNSQIPGERKELWVLKDSPGDAPIVLENPFEHFFD